MGKVIDFVKYNGWGHALHSSTFSATEADSYLQKFLDWFGNRRRYSVMVHSMKYPEVGDRVRIKTSGGIQEPLIYRVEPCRDPEDMFTLWLLFTPESLVKVTA